MTANTILLTGLPRAGTTLSCHILNNCPATLALHEPMKPGDFEPAAGTDAAVLRIQQFAEATRQQVLREGKALSQQKDGAVPENPVAANAVAGGLRPMDVSLGLIDVSARVLPADFTLIIKHNALFTALLPELAASFPMYAIVRNPLAVLASWNLVDLPINKGHIPAAEQFDRALKNTLAATHDVLDRQLHILEWFCVRYVQHLNGRWLRYEDFVIDPLTLVSPLGLPAPATSIPTRASKNAGYDLVLMEQLYTRVSGFGEAIWSIYPRAQVDELMETIRASQ
ncbi:sulfotransferase [Cellvibrio sp. KY-GH-1]|uniref:sulfotransferase n=1 Tax=Cellvibrio sp. KY-GH-1 TaxID=2303332 RepID=UPI0012445427|nr:sulfotransferase [Cellvibrio sp. KY-GH-1]